MLVRTAVSGVRSSWLASTTRRCCCSRDVSSAISMVLKLAASRPDLVVALHRDRGGEVLGLGDALGGVGELLDRPRGAPHHQPRRQRGERDAGEGDDHQPRAEHVEHVVGLRHLAGDLHRAAVAQRHGDHAVARCRRRSRRGSATARPLRAIGRSSASIGSCGWSGSELVIGAVAVDGLLHRVEFEEWTAVAVAVVVGRCARRSHRCRGGCATMPAARSCRNLSVSSRSASSRAHVRRVGAADHRHRHDHRDDDGEAGPQAHRRLTPVQAGRAVYPTPRTVWMRRVSPASSVLRRR